MPVHERKDEFGKTVFSQTARMKFIDFSPNWVGNEFQLEGFQLETPRQHTAFSKTYYLSIVGFRALTLTAGWLLRRHSVVQIAASSGSDVERGSDRTGLPGIPPLDGPGGESAP